MALGKRPSQQQEMWVATTDLPKSEGHVFYRKLNEILAEARFDAWVEKKCRPYYHDRLGRPSIPPGVYFRMLLIGYVLSAVGPFLLGFARDVTGNFVTLGAALVLGSVNRNAC